MLEKAEKLDNWGPPTEALFAFAATKALIRDELVYTSSWNERGKTAFALLATYDCCANCKKITFLNNFIQYQVQFHNFTHIIQNFQGFPPIFLPGLDLFVSCYSRLSSSEKEHLVIQTYLMLQLAWPI